MSKEEKMRDHVRMAREKMYQIGKESCPFCKPGMNRMGSVFLSGRITPDMPNIEESFLNEHFIIKNCVKEKSIGLSIRLMNLLEDPDYSEDHISPMLNASVDIKDERELISTDDFIPDVSIPIRFCPMCGREIGKE